MTYEPSKEMKKEYTEHIIEAPTQTDNTERGNDKNQRFTNTIQESENTMIYEGAYMPKQLIGLNDALQATWSSRYGCATLRKRPETLISWSIFNTIHGKRQIWEPCRYINTTGIRMNMQRYKVAG